MVQVPDPWFAARDEAAQIATQLFTGGYDGTEGEDGSNDTTWTDFGIVCGIADRLAEALKPFLDYYRRERGVIYGFGEDELAPLAALAAEAAHSQEKAP